jgi:hypothetical protein
MVDGSLKYICSEVKEDNLHEPTISRYGKSIFLNPFLLL